MSTAITLDAIKSTQKKLADMIATFEAQSSAISLPVTISKPDLDMNTATADSTWHPDLLKEGEIDAGIILGKNGEKDYRLILLPGDVSMTWAKAKKWAAENGGELPSRREQSLLFANCQEHFEKDWYWSGEQHAAVSYYAWFQDFNRGIQYDTLTSSKLPARAVRRIPIE